VTRRLVGAASLAAIVASMVLPFEQAGAHGGKLQRGLAPAGPYVVSVWTQPDPARVGALDISAAILRADTHQPVPDVEMRVTARDSSSSQFVQGVGLRPAQGLLDLFAPPLYHASVGIPTRGQWHLTVSIAGAVGHGAIDFDLDVAPPLPWRLIVAGGVVSLLVVVAWFVPRRSTRQRRAGSSARHDTEPSGSAKRDSGSVTQSGRMP